MLELYPKPQATKFGFTASFASEPSAVGSTQAHVHTGTASPSLPPSLRLPQRSYQPQPVAAVEEFSGRCNRQVVQGLSRALLCLITKVLKWQHLA